MNDPLSEPSSTDTTRSDTTSSDTTSSDTTSDADAPTAAAPMMSPPTGPVPTQPYTWPAPTGAPTGAGMGAHTGTPTATLPTPAVAGRRSDTYRGLTIASFVLSVIAVLGVLLIGLFMLGTSAATLTDDADSGPVVPLTGSVSVAAGHSLPGDDLANAVEQRIRDDGAGDVEMDCPATSKVAQGVVTVCHGQIEGDEWAVVVYFEDELGSFTLNPL